MKRVIALLLPPLFPAVLACFDIVNGDIGFHIATGRAIELLGKIPTTNVLSFAQPDQPWILHQWIPAWLFYRVDLLAGPAGLVLLKCVVIYLTFLFLWAAMLVRSGALAVSDGPIRTEATEVGAEESRGVRISSGEAMALFWFILSAGASSCRFFVRPFIFSMLGLAVLLYLFSRFERGGRTRWLYAAGPVTAVFAALHAGVVYLLLVFAALAAGSLLARLAFLRADRSDQADPAVSKRSSSLAIRSMRRSIAPCLPGGVGANGSGGGKAPNSPTRPAYCGLVHIWGAFGLALVSSGLAVYLESPWGLEALTLPFRFSMNEYFHEHLIEFRPLPFNLKVFPFAWVLVAALPICLGVFLFKERPASRTAAWLRSMLFDIFIAAGFLYLVLKHQRIVFAFALVAGFVLVRWSRPIMGGRTSKIKIRRLSPQTVAYSQSGQPALWGRRQSRGAALVWILVLCALATAAWASYIHFSHARLGLGLDDRYYPQALFRFVKEHRLPGEVYVSDGWGGQWLWEFYPERKVFYDNRLEAYSFEFFRDQYQAIRYGEPGWQEKLDRFGVRTLVLKYSTPKERELQNFQPNIRDLAFLSARWHLVYWDDLGMVFVNAGELDSCAGCSDYRLFNPDSFFRVPGANDVEFMREIQRAWEEMPSARSCYVLAVALLEKGDEPGARNLVAEGLARFPGNPLLERLSR